MNRAERAASQDNNAPRPTLDGSSGVLPVLRREKRQPIQSLGENGGEAAE